MSKSEWGLLSLAGKFWMLAAVAASQLVSRVSPAVGQAASPALPFNCTTANVSAIASLFDAPVLTREGASELVDVAVNMAGACFGDQPIFSAHNACNTIGDQKTPCNEMRFVGFEVSAGALLCHQHSMFGPFENPFANCVDPQKFFASWVLNQQALLLKLPRGVVMRVPRQSAGISLTSKGASVDDIAAVLEFFRDALSAEVLPGMSVILSPTPALLEAKDRLQAIFGKDLRIELRKRLKNLTGREMVTPAQCQAVAAAAAKGELVAQGEGMGKPTQPPFTIAQIHAAAECGVTFFNLDFVEQFDVRLIAVVSGYFAKLARGCLNQTSNACELLPVLQGALTRAASFGQQPLPISQRTFDPVWLITDIKSFFDYLYLTIGNQPLQAFMNSIRPSKNFDPDSFLSSTTLMTIFILLDHARVGLMPSEDGKKIRVALSVFVAAFESLFTAVHVGGEFLRHNSNEKRTVGLGVSYLITAGLALSGLLMNELATCYRRRNYDSLNGASLNLPLHGAVVSDISFFKRMKQRVANRPLVLARLFFGVMQDMLVTDGNQGPLMMGTYLAVLLAHILPQASLALYDRARDRRHRGSGRGNLV